MKEIYLDNCATTPTDPHIAQLALQMMTETFGNPSSLHQKGLDAQLCLEKARRQMANALSCQPEEIYFTSGGTESNNLAIQGAYAAHHRRGNRLITTGVEHSSVTGPLQYLGEQGAEAILLEPNPDGSISPEAVAQAVDDSTLLVSCCLVNSEVGAISPIDRIAKLAKGKNPRVLVHCDAVQAFGKQPVSVRRLGVDLLSISGHKLHAPKGIGALYVKKGVRILPLFQGGGQQGKLRPGTENVALACALGQAAEDSVTQMKERQAHFASLREYCVNKAAGIPEICINSPPDGAPNICNISLPGWRSETLLHYLAKRNIYVSSGSACSKGADSRVLTAMGLPRNRIKSALRVSFSKKTTTGDIDGFFTVLSQGLQEITRSND